MICIRRKKTSCRDLQKQQTAPKQRPFWKKAAPLVAAIALAVVGGGYVLKQKSGPANQTPRQEISDLDAGMKERRQERKKKLFINLMIHQTAEEEVCYLRKGLDRARPDLVFLEFYGTTTTHENKRRFEFRWNGNHAYSDEELFRMSMVIRKLHSYSRTRAERIRLFFAESYSGWELDQGPARGSSALWHAIDNRTLQLYQNGMVNEAVDLYLSSWRSLASKFRFRHDRIVETIERDWDSSHSSAMLLIGAAHQPLSRMFKERGYDVEFINPTESYRLVNLLEYSLRGWASPSEESLRSEAARGILCNVLAKYYMRLGWSGSGPVREICFRTIPSFSVQNLEMFRREGYHDPIEIISSFGYDFPSDRMSFERLRDKLGLCPR